MTTAASLAVGISSPDFPTPHPNFLTQILNTRGNPPLAALLKTTKLRLLAADFTAPQVLSDSTLAFPRSITAATVKETRIEGPIFVQVLAVEDLSRSRWEQIEAIEAIERGEATRGREVIRIVSDEGEDGVEQGRSAAAGRGMGAAASRNAIMKGGPHKLVLQDVKGQRVFAFEQKPVESVGLGMNIGSKMVLRNVLVARGVVLLQPRTAKMLGGKLEELHRAWLENRKTDLRANIDPVADQR